VPEASTQLAHEKARRIDGSHQILLKKRRQTRKMIQNQSRTESCPKRSARAECTERVGTFATRPDASGIALKLPVLFCDLLQIGEWPDHRQMIRDAAANSAKYSVGQLAKLRKRCIVQPQRCAQTFEQRCVDLFVRCLDVERSDLQECWASRTGASGLRKAHRMHLA